MRRTGLLAVACVGLVVACGDGDVKKDGEPAAPRRVVVLAPAAAEMLTALDLDDRVVGIGEFGPWPAGLELLPVVGGYDRPNVERVLELQADLLLSTASEAADPAYRRLETLGVPVLALDTSTHSGVFEALTIVGRTFGREEAAAAVTQRMNEELSSIVARASELTARRVLFVVGRDPLYVAGPGSHIHEMIRSVGGENVAADAASPYQQVSLETILERLPEVIIDTSDNGAEALRGRQPGAWGRWEFLPAVRDNRVYWIEPGRLVIPGIRLPEMTRLMGQLVHPEVFGEADTTTVAERSP